MPKVRDEGQEQEFWSARPVLTRLHAFARARRAAPWAVLSATLCRVVCEVDPGLVLPPLVGGVASLNLFAALVGESGSGKDAAQAVARDALSVAGPGELVVVTPGSGEGIAHAYMRRTKQGVEQHTVSALFVVSEVDTLAALAQRRGTTLLPELRMAWMGHRLGFQYADKDKRLPVPEQGYRLCLIVGVQPHRAAVLLEDSDGGTPQRFVWAHAADPEAPDVRPPTPEPWEWVPPAPSGLRHVRVCERARLEVDASSLARARGLGDPLDGHRLLCQLKVAAALGLLDGRPEVEDEDWRLAGLVLAHSARVRSEVGAGLVAVKVAANRGRALVEADRQLTVAERTADAAVRRVSDRMVRLLRERDDWVAGGELRRRAGRDREWLDEALERAVADGRVKAEETDRAESGHGGTGRRYRSVP